MDLRSKTVQMLANEWRSAGLTEGDTVLIHSSISRTMKRMKKIFTEATPQDLLSSFILAVGSDKGTLLLPLFNFDFAKGVTFDIRSTQSQMGALTEAGRLFPGAVRTGHPIYSFAVIGREKHRFVNLRNFSGYGSDSPFAILRDLDGKIAILDLEDQDSITYYHHVEEMENVPYRYHKKFTAPYIDRDGDKKIETFGLFVRDLEKGVRTHVNPTGELLWSKGFYSGCRPGDGHGLRVISVENLYKITSGIIKDGKALGMLYRLASNDHEA